MRDLTAGASPGEAGKRVFAGSIQRNAVLVKAAFPLPIGGSAERFCMPND